MRLLTLLAVLAAAGCTPPPPPAPPPTEKLPPEVEYDAKTATEMHLKNKNKKSAPR